MTINKYIYITIVLSLLVLISYEAKTQVKSIGVPAITNYTKNQYDAATQNWDIAQDNSGIIYFANNNGLLAFDGTDWNITRINPYFLSRKLIIDKYNRIYVGSFNDFGYLQKDIYGNLKYFSLADSLPQKQRDFSDIWGIHINPMGVYFQAFNRLFFYDYENVVQISDNPDFHFSYYVNNRMLIQDKKAGVYELRGDKLYSVIGMDFFTGDVEIWGMLPFSDDSLLIATQRHGLFLYDGYTAKKFECDANEKLIENQIFSAIKLPGNYYSIGTIRDGLYIINQSGTIVQHLNKEKGLLNNTILSQFVDHNGQLWLGLDNGISCVEISSPFSYLNDGLDIEGTGYASVLHDSILYLGTNQGVFYRNIDAKAVNSSFKRVENTTGQVWNLSVFDNQVFCGHSYGTFLINNDKATQISKINGAWIFQPVDKNTLLSGNYKGLVKYKKENNQWQYDKKVKGITESCRFIVKETDESLWISHGQQGVFRVRLNHEKDSVLSINFYSDKDGLPSKFDTYVYRLNNEVIFCSEKGIYRFDETTKKFEEHKEMNTLFKNINAIRIPKVDANGNIWFTSKERPYLLKKIKENKYQLVDSIFIPFSNEIVGSFEHINIINENNVIIALKEGFVHYNAELYNKKDDSFNCQIKHLLKIESGDTIALWKKKNNSLSMEMREKISIPHKSNSLRFVFAAPYFKNSNQIRFSFHLEGFQQKWSEWQSVTEKEYTNLPPGKYTFKVRAINVYDKISPTVQVSFSIQVPWYRSLLAYIIYFTLFVLIAFLVSRFVKRRMELERQELKEKQKRELTAKEEEHTRKEIIARQKIIKLKNEKLEIEVAKKRSDVELKNKELASIALQITHKNEIMFEVKRELEHVARKVNRPAKTELNNLINKIEQDLKMDDDWDKFKKHFDDVHAGFFKRLKETFPLLTPKDLKVCAYLRMNLSTKEIAQLLNISIRGVEMSRYRLRKKMNLDKDVNLIEYMMNI